MSAYREMQTQIKDEECLVEALQSLGKKAERHDTAKPLVGYQGDERKDTAEVIIRRKDVGSSSNDIGFKRNESGVFKAIISEFDSSKYNKDWLAKVSVEYAKIYSTKIAKKQGFKLTNTQTTGGKTRLVFTQNKF